ncbi:zinc finger protein weckle [Drosophila bipectinata]|uniref:zinc finger protein weckle n=1 Tax=Drosophila bipectinata TaxID=42026 RepID=UPI001C89B205|nr:zinc finger protein weckle [Drosophila bipectinata]
MSSLPGTESPSSDATIWRRWCRLCAKDHPNNRNAYYPKDEGESWSNTLAMAIGKYFWVDIKQEDELSNHLCTECFTLIERLIEFSERVRRVQTLFNKLSNLNPGTSANFESLRTECGLVSSEWKHVMSRAVEESEPLKTSDGARKLEELVAELEVEASEEMGTLDYIEDEEDAHFEDEEFKESEIIDMEENIKADGQVAMKPNESVSDEDEFLEDLGLIIEEDEDEDEDEEEEEPLYEPTTYKCNICSKTYKKHKAFQRHMEEIHHTPPSESPQLECDQCGLSFSRASQLNAHYRTHQSSKEKQDNCCPHCNKNFTTVGTLKRHIEGVHKQIKPYECALCGKGFKYLTGLKEHKLVHTDDCPFECPVCRRRFKNKARLKIHSDIHSSNIYECTICGMKLKTRRTFNKHKLVHSDERQFKCDVCGASFKRSKTLKSHLILHTGIRPYKCNFCGRDFSNGSNCRSHKRQTHPEELAEEEKRGISRSTLLPLMDELTKASKLIKTPAKRSKAKKIASKSPVLTTPSPSKNPDDVIVYELVQELAFS